jgi:ankyrin repeat protein
MKMTNNTNLPVERRIASYTLVEACYLLDECVVRDALAAGADANMWDTYEPMYAALYHQLMPTTDGDEITQVERIVKMLLRKGADPDRRDEGMDDSPVFWAAYHGWDGVVQTLLNAGADVNLRGSGKDADPSKILSQPVILGNVGLVKILLAAGAEIDDIDGCGRDAMALLCAQFPPDHPAYQEIATELRSRYPGRWSDRYPVERGTGYLTDWVATKFRNPYDDYKQSNPPRQRYIDYSLRSACRDGSDVEAVEYALVHGADPNYARGCYLPPLHSALDYAREDMDLEPRIQIVNLLFGRKFDHKADINLRDVDGCVALAVAVKRHLLPLLRLLADHEADPENVDGRQHNIVQFSRLYCDPHSNKSPWQSYPDLQELLKECYPEMVMDGWVDAARSEDPGR